jgi:hypothetical protein
MKRILFLVNPAAGRPETRDRDPSDGEKKAGSGNKGAPLAPPAAGTTAGPPPSDSPAFDLLACHYGMVPPDEA